MNKPTRATTPSGEEIVMLPTAEYERLLAAAEDTRDVAIVDDTLEGFRAGEGEVLTEADMRALLDASSPLAFWRKRRNLTQTELAEKVDVSQAYLAQIEGGKRTGDVALYRRLAQALGVGMEDVSPGRGSFEEVTMPGHPKTKRWYHLRPAVLPGVAHFADDDGFHISVSCPDKSGEWALFSVNLNRAQAEHLESALRGCLKGRRKK